MQKAPLGIGSQGNLFSKLLILLSLIAIMGLGCGGDGGDSSVSVQQGQFIDSPVHGLGYRTRSHEGITDAKGIFHYAAQESITFYIGNIKLGSAKAKAIITPLDLVTGAKDELNPVVTNICRFLLTLDDDADSDNGTFINARVRAAANNYTINFNVRIEVFETDADVLNAIAALTALTSAGQRALIDAVTAQAHLRNTLAGFYNRAVINTANAVNNAGASDNQSDNSSVSGDQSTGTTADNGEDENENENGSATSDPDESNSNANNNSAAPAVDTQSDSSSAIGDESTGTSADNGKNENENQSATSDPDESNGNTNNNSTTSAVKNGKLRLSVKTGPSQKSDITAVWLDVREVLVCGLSGGCRTVGGETRINLLATDPPGVLLADVYLPEDKINQLRLVLGDQNEVVTDGETYPLVTPSGSQTGLKLIGDWPVEGGKLTTIILDFDLDHSIVQNNKGYKLKPVIKISSVKITDIHEIKSLKIGDELLVIIPEIAIDDPSVLWVEAIENYGGGLSGAGF